ncbi:MAG: 5'-nucleotidase C-terminal domain-containing protein [Lewinellaceae bacterium]|nr:5'-nucleotidase C-terminal domain-containing protein [Lewinellaceae bacterium]
MTGQQLLDWLEKELNNVFAKDAPNVSAAGSSSSKACWWEFMAFAEPGKRVQKVTVNGQPLDPARIYTVAACERDGDPPTMLCRIQNVQDAVNTPYTLHQTMRDYLAANSPVTPKPRGYAKVLDAPQTLLTQVTGVDYTFSVVLRDELTCPACENTLQPATSNPPTRPQPSNHLTFQPATFQPFQPCKH